MNYLKKYIPQAAVTIAMVILMASCKKDGNPNNLPGVSPADYAGTIDGFKSSDEIFPSNLVAYWSFDDTRNELKSGKTPTESPNTAFVNTGVRGKAISLNAGYLYYASQFNAFKTDSLKSFTVSMWVQILNNGSKRTQIFQVARPGLLNGNIDFILDTDINPPSVTNYIRIRSFFTTVGNQRQDNINDFGQRRSPQFGATKWTHLVMTYNASTGVFNIWGDAVKIGNFPNRGTSPNNLFKSWEPSEVILGGTYNLIPGKAVNGDQSFAAMTGSMDEVRVYNRELPDAFIKALYNLGVAGK